jgi:molybdenum cofactor biosynthesis enzyme MoaA
MNIDNIKKIELEITSACNAACPGCSRTQYPDLLQIQSLTLLDIKRLFPTERYIKDKQFKFCGVLGDPASNPECIDMVEYLVGYGGYCQLSTNGGIQPANWWRRLGELSKITGLVDINFCIDGHKETNHIYRVNTVFDTIARNMRAYADGGEGQAKAAWVYIVFDHNEHEQYAAEAHARELGFRFAIRTGMRNSLNSWTAQIKKRDAVTKKLVTEPQVITTTGSKEHSKVAVVEKLGKFIESYTGLSQKVKAAVPQVKPKEKKPMPAYIPIMDDDLKQEVIASIKCKLIHEGEIFIASNQTMWPCCFLWDSAFKDSSVDYINEKLAEYGGDWNSLTDKTIDEVLQHPWFDSILKDSWDPAHEKHLPRCIKTCAYNKAYQNEIKEKPAQ